MQLSGLTATLDALKVDAADLFGAYENDEDLVDLKERAVNIRERASCLVAALETINDGLAEL